MKRVKLLSICLLLFSMWGCNETSIHKVSSSGKPYDIFVVMSDLKWKSAVGDTLRSILLEEIPMLNQREPFFDVYQVAPDKFKGIVRDHRNVIMYRVSAEKYPNPSMTAEYDITAYPQLIVSVNAPSDSSAIRYMYENRKALQDIFIQGEKNLFVNNTKKNNDPVLNDKIQQMFGIDMKIPRGYKIRSEKPNFLWISNELPIVSQGIFIYKYPLTDKNTFTDAYLTNKRNEFAKLIPGPSAGSYMTTSEEVEPVFSKFRLYGRLWFELRGFWDVSGDFMGGPFVSYTTILAGSKEVLTIDSYIHSPKHGKRNYIRQLENMIYLIEFSKDTSNFVKIDGDSIR